MLTETNRKDITYKMELTIFFKIIYLGMIKALPIVQTFIPYLQVIYMITIIVFTCIKISNYFKNSTPTV